MIRSPRKYQLEVITKTPASSSLKFQLKIYQPTNQPTNQPSASQRPLVCSAIPACDRIAGLINRNLNSNWDFAYANGYSWWTS